MNIRGFVASVLSGAIKIVGGGRSDDGYFTGEVDPAALTSADIAAEAIGRDVEGTASIPLSQVATVVEAERMRILSRTSLVEAVFSHSNKGFIQERRDAIDRRLEERQNLRMRLVDMVFKNCGTGAGGFQPGNTCGSGGGGIDDTKNIGSRVTDPSEAQERMNAITQHLREMSGAKFTKAAEKILVSVGVAKEDAKEFLKDLNRAANSTNRTMVDEIAGHQPMKEEWSKDEQATTTAGTIAGVVAGFAVYSEITGESLSEVMPTPTGMEPLRLTAVSQNTGTAGLFILVDKDRKGVYQYRPEIRINTRANASNQYDERRARDRGQLPHWREAAQRGINASHSIGEGIVAIGDSFGSADEGKLRDAEYTGDRAALSRMMGSTYGRAAMRSSFVVLHELGHWRHYQEVVRSTPALQNTNPVERHISALKAWKEIGSRDVGERFREPDGSMSFSSAHGIALGGVSKYASTSNKELVAEVFAGLALGRRFSEEVMTAYRKLNGPSIKRRA